MRGIGKEPMSSVLAFSFAMLTLAAFTFTFLRLAFSFTLAFAVRTPRSSVERSPTFAFVMVAIMRVV